MDILLIALLLSIGIFMLNGKQQRQAEQSCGDPRQPIRIASGDRVGCSGRRVQSGLLGMAYGQGAGEEAWRAISSTAACASIRVKMLVSIDADVGLE